MTEVVGIKFKSGGKMYYFDPAGIQVKKGERVVVETSKGLELGECARGNYMVEDEKIIPPLRTVVRVATQDDLKREAANRSKEEEALRICKERIQAHELAMKLVGVEYNFEGTKILFFFTSEGRVDFRELVKDLAGIFHTRIELRQIGVRDEAKLLGGIGICGRPYCCKQFMDEFEPVSTKMAKTQSMSLNPAKISGSCGRLMCCLRYEQEAYTDLIKSMPKNGAYVETPDGYGNVTQVNLLRQQVKVRIDGESDMQQGRTYESEDVAVVPGGRPKPGETPPHVLKPRVKVEEKPVEDDWSLTGWYTDTVPVQEKTLGERIAEAGQEPSAKKNDRRRSRGKGGKGGKPQNKHPQSGGQKDAHASSGGQNKHTANDEKKQHQHAPKAQHSGGRQKNGQKPQRSSENGQKNAHPQGGSQKSQSQPQQKPANASGAAKPPQQQQKKSGSGNGKRRRYYGSNKSKPKPKTDA